MKKLLKLAAAGLMIFGLAACGGGGSTSDSSSASKASSDKDPLQSIKDAGVLKVGLSADYSPFEFHALIDGKDKIVGADVDLMNAIGKELGVKVEFMDMDFDAVLTALQQGKVDMAASGISATPERKESFDFSINYYNPPMVLVINKKNADTITSVDDTKGKKIGAQKGSIQEDIVKDKMPDANLVSVAKVPNLVVELKQGSIDGLVLEKTIADSYISQNSDLQLSEVEFEADKDEAFSVAMPKNSGDLKTEVDKIVQKLLDEGKIDEFVEKNVKVADESAVEK